MSLNGLDVAPLVVFPILVSGGDELRPGRIATGASQSVGSRAIISAEQDSPDTPAALTDALGHLLVTFIFARLADE